jgi:tRNA pseudouridine32 synthase/23S rRNA pseudouridine746 synthase
MPALPYHALPPDSPPEVVYADEELMIVAKPTGLLSVPGRGEDKQDCLIARLQTDWPGARIVHRLDRDTSGLLVVARNADSHRELSRQFQDREVGKRYIALVLGQLSDAHGNITLPIRYDPPTKPRHVVDLENGQPSLTEWHLLKQHEEYARVALIPHTGRSHQLRVHMLAIGHPMLGDALYAPENARPEGMRLCLHAESLSFTHPTQGHRLSFHYPAPF